MSDLEKGKLIKESLKIVDELANAVDEMAEFTVDEQETILDLVERARKLKKNRFWKLT
jgi:hypothetical protein